MNSKTKNSPFDDVIGDDSNPIDTSMFNAEEIVKNIEKNDAQASALKKKEKSKTSRRRFEALQEEKRLQAELHDLDDYLLDED